MSIIEILPVDWLNLTFFLICQSFLIPRLSNFQEKTNTAVYFAGPWAAGTSKLFVSESVGKKRKQNKMAARQQLDSTDLGVRLSTVSAPSLFYNKELSSLRLNFLSSSVQSICTRIRQVTLGHSALSPNSLVSFVSPQVQSSFLPPVFSLFVICFCLFYR